MLSMGLMIDRAIEVESYPLFLFCNYKFLKGGDMRKRKRGRPKGSTNKKPSKKLEGRVASFMECGEKKTGKVINMGYRESHIFGKLKFYDIQTADGKVVRRSQSSINIRGVDEAYHPRGEI